MRAFCDGKIKNLLPLTVLEFQKISQNAFAVQNEVLNGFMALPKTRKADVLNFFAKFT